MHHCFLTNNVMLTLYLSFAALRKDNKNLQSTSRLSLLDFFWWLVSNFGFSLKVNVCDIDITTTTSGRKQRRAWKWERSSQGGLWGAALSILCICCQLLNKQEEASHSTSMRPRNRIWDGNGYECKEQQCNSKTTYVWIWGSDHNHHHRHNSSNQPWQESKRYLWVGEEAHRTRQQSKISPLLFFWLLFVGDCHTRTSLTLVAIILQLYSILGRSVS